MRGSEPSDADREDVLRSRSGDAAAVARLVAKHQDHVYRLALRVVGRPEDAEEVTQQTFLSLMEHLEGFRGQAAFGTWLARIATNHGLSLLRRRGPRADAPRSAAVRVRPDDLPLDELVARWRQTPEELAAQKELRQILTETLDQLDLKYSMVFVLRDLEGLSTRETAEVLDLRPGAVKVRLLRARRMLRQRLAERLTVRSDTPGLRG